MNEKPMDAETMSSLLARQVALRPNAPAITENGHTVDWQTLERRASGLAAQFEALGVGRGDRIAFWLPNGVAYAAAIFAAARRGTMAVHINTRFGAEEVGDMIARTGAKLLLTQPSFAAVDFLAILGAIDPAKLASLGTILCDGACRTDDRRFVAARYDGWVDDIASPDDAALVFTTGGTTAKPKLVVHHQRSIANHAQAVMRRIGTDQPGATLLGVVPFCGTFGNVALMSAVAGGAHIVAMAGFDDRAADSLIRAHAVTHLVGDDRMMARLIAVAETEGAHRSLRFSGVAGFHPGALETFERAAAVGLCPHSLYGSSEVQALFATGDQALRGGGPVTPVSPAAGFEIQGGEDGELLLSGPSLFAHYLDNPGATAKAMAGGLFHSGDRAHREGDGFVFDGRLGDALRLGGFLVNPMEIESFLETQDGVTAAQVVALEGAHDIRPFAFVLSEHGREIDEAAILGACRARLARYKVPTRIVRLDAFPTSMGPNGPKILRTELRRMAAEMQAASGP